MVFFSFSFDHFLSKSVGVWPFHLAESHAELFTVDAHAVPGVEQKSGLAIFTVYAVKNINFIILYNILYDTLNLLLLTIVLLLRLALWPLCLLFMNWRTLIS